jgi:hypothetical protein
MESKQRRTLLVGILLGLTMAFCVQCFSETSTDEALGRYQVSTCIEAAQDPHIYVTLIDTETGAIIRLERYSSEAYKKIKIGE